MLLFCLFAVPVGAETVEYYHTDGVGNVRVVTDESGAVIERHDYLPFGEECTTGACASNPGIGAGQPRKFTGKERDTETGLDYFGARYYSAGRGRWTTPDRPRADQHPEDPQSWNLYAYVRNNPVRNVDPSGRACLDHTGAAGCWQYTIGIAKELANIPNNTLNMFVDAENLVVSPFTEGRFQKLPTYQPANEDQAEGMRAMSVGLLFYAATETAWARLGPRVTAADAAEASQTQVTAPYRRPSGATTSEQRAIVQGQPCVDCGQTAARMFADHKTPLVKEYYETGKIDTVRMHDVNSVQPQCPTCSARQGAQLSRYSSAMKKELQ